MKKLFMVVLIIFLGVGLVSCGNENENQPDSNTQELPHITIGLLPDLESIPFVVAELSGAFADEGVDVTLECFMSAKDRDSALQAGKLDGVVNDLVAVFFNNEGGLPLRAVTKTSGRLAMLASPEFGIDTLTAVAVEGKQIGLSLNTVMEYNVDRMLQSQDIDPNSVIKVSIPQIPVRMEMLVGEKLDLAIMPDPFVTMAAGQGAKVMIESDDMPHTAGVVSFRIEILEEKPDAVAAVMRAYRSTAQDLNDQGLGQYRDAVIERLSLPDESHELLELPYYNPILPSEETVRDVQSWMHEKALIEGEYAYAEIVINVE